MGAMLEVQSSSEGLHVLWRQNPIFAAIDDEAALEAFITGCAHGRVPPGEVILEAGAASGELYVVLAGTVRIFHRAPDGREAVVKLLRAPSVFAELELLHQLPLLESVSAVDEVLLARAPGAGYIALLHRFPAAMFAHLKHLAAAFCVAVRNEQQVFAPLEDRIANLLLSYADLEGGNAAAAKDEPLALACPLSQNDIAQSLGAAHRSVARILSTWQKSRLLEHSASGWTLLDRPALEELAGAIRHSLNYQMGMALTPLASRPSAGRARLEIAAGHPRWVGRAYDVEEEMIIGRQAPARLLLPSDTLSPQHCRVFRAARGGRYWLEDLGSQNGSEVNEKEVKRCVLRDGDRIRVGGFTLDFHLDSDTEG
jgi:CRP/FNR family transcriptional regulator, cyclic AMP receptor protein